MIYNGIYSCDECGAEIDDTNMNGVCDTCDYNKNVERFKSHDDLRIAGIDNTPQEVYNESRYL